MKVGLISGSLRQGSYNTALLKTMSDMLPQGVEGVWADIAHLPYYNEDLEHALPKEVDECRRLIESVDIIWIATPEYNHHTSGVLKNAIDWLSRPHLDSALTGKPVVIMGAGIARTGTARVLMSMRELFFSLHSEVYRKHEINIGRAFEVFDKNGELIDESFRTYLSVTIKDMLDWAKHVKKLSN